MDTTVPIASATGATASSTTRNNSLGTTSAKEINDRFLKLLVAQMRNQDPLNPVDNAQVTSQLSQISTVSGIESLNQTVRSLVGQLSSLQSLQATSMTGRDVMVTGNTLNVGAGGGARGGIRLNGSASEVTVTIKDAGGRTVRTVALGSANAGVRNFDWDGRLESGGSAVPGAGYSFTVEAKQGGQAVSADTLARARVEGVLRDGDAVQLNLGVLGARPLNDVIQVL